MCVEYIFFFCFSRDDRDTHSLDAHKHIASIAVSIAIGYPCAVVLHVYTLYDCVHVGVVSTGKKIKICFVLYTPVERILATRQSIEVKVNI